MGKFKVYELDFGDTNVLSESIGELLAWIESDMQELEEGSEELQYTIGIKMMTREEIEAIPEWS